MSRAGLRSERRTLSRAQKKNLFISQAELSTFTEKQIDYGAIIFGGKRFNYTEKQIDYGAIIFGGKRWILHDDVRILHVTDSRQAAFALSWRAAAADGRSGGTAGCFVY